jgi:hypothetical protein
MNASSAPKTPPTALEMFTARRRARTALYAADEIPDLHDVVDALLKHAERHGLIAEIGQDAMLEVVSKAFRLARATDVP